MEAPTCWSGVTLVSFPEEQTGMRKGKKVLGQKTQEDGRMVLFTILLGHEGVLKAGMSYG